MKAELVLDALEQARWSRSGIDGVVHHSDQGRQYLSIRYSERLAEVGAVPSVGRVGDSYDNALAEPSLGYTRPSSSTTWGLRHLKAVEYATLEWVDWFNHAGCWNRLAMCRQWSWNRQMNANRKSQPERPDSTSTVSGKTRAVQSTKTGGADDFELAAAKNTVRPSEGMAEGAAGALDTTTAFDAHGCF